MDKHNGVFNCINFAASFMEVKDGEDKVQAKYLTAAWQYPFFVSNTEEIDNIYISSNPGNRRQKL